MKQAYSRLAQALASVSVTVSVARKQHATLEF